jgi:hypothetical protein
MLILLIVVLIFLFGGGYYHGEAPVGAVAPGRSRRSHDLPSRHARGDAGARSIVHVGPDWAGHVLKRLRGDGRARHAVTLRTYR